MLLNLHNRELNKPDLTPTPPHPSAGDLIQSLARTKQVPPVFLIKYLVSAILSQQQKTDYESYQRRTDVHKIKQWTRVTEKLESFTWYKFTIHSIAGAVLNTENSKPDLFLALWSSQSS
jgi:hypothetical protein